MSEMEIKENAEYLKSAQLKLKECPFCGNKAIDFLHIIHKEKCYLYMDTDKLGVDAFIKIWNTRPLEDALQAKLDRAKEEIQQIKNWAQAYPIDIFTEPDWGEVKQLLGSNLLTCVSASNMRLVITSVEKHADKALKELE